MKPQGSVESSIKVNIECVTTYKLCRTTRGGSRGKNEEGLSREGALESPAFRSVAVCAYITLGVYCVL